MKGASREIRVVAKKDSRFWRLLGKVSKVAYELTWTTIGHTIYYPPYVTDPFLPKYEVDIAHELVHVKQYEKYGVPLFLFLYLFIPLPCFFSYFRWRFEREAYLEDLANSNIKIQQVIDILWKDYFYPWPRSWMNKWFEKNV